MRCTVRYMVRMMRIHWLPGQRWMILKKGMPRLLTGWNGVQMLRLNSSLTH